MTAEGGDSSSGGSSGRRARGRDALLDHCDLDEEENFARIDIRSVYTVRQAHRRTGSRYKNTR